MALIQTITILLSSHLTKYHHEGIRKQTEKCRLNILIDGCHFKLMSQGFFPLDKSLVLYEIGFLFVHVLKGNVSLIPCWPPYKNDRKFLIFIFTPPEYWD